MVDLAVKASLGMKLRDLGFGTGLYRKSRYTAVKVPVFSFEKLIDVDVQLGPEMKSTGEVLGIGRDLKEALYKGLLGAGYKMFHEGGVFFTVRRSDKKELPALAEKFAFGLQALLPQREMPECSGRPDLRLTWFRRSMRTASTTA